MSLVDLFAERLIPLVDRFVPPNLNDASSQQRVRATIAGSWLGLFFSISTGVLYNWAGSALSAFSIHLITAGLALTPFALRRGASTYVVGNVMVALTAQASAVVTWRSGGFASPAASWFFMLPLIAYLACGHRSAVAWGAIAIGSLGGFFVLGASDVVAAQDFSPAMLSVLRISGYAGVIFSVVALLVVIEGIRSGAEEALHSAQRAHERERILRDLHDGVGSQLLGLITRARAGTLETSTLERELQACFDDLRLIVCSLDPVEPSLEETFAELRVRVRPMCDALGISLAWFCDDAAQLRPSAEATLALLRAVQEMVSNAVRHSRAKHITLRLSLASESERVLRVSVEDDGIGFGREPPPRVGRGLPSLRVRAKKLGGSLHIASSAAGTRVELVIPFSQADQLDKVRS